MRMIAAWFWVIVGKLIGVDREPAPNPDQIPRNFNRSSGEWMDET